MQNLFAKPERKILLERPGRRLKDNIKMALMEMVWKVVDSINPARNRD
jgi:hypothetical protein